MNDIGNHWSIIRREWMIAAANFLSCVVTGNGYLENLVSEMAGLTGGQNILKKKKKKCQHFNTKPT